MVKIDDEKLKNEVIPLIEKLIGEYKAHNITLCAKEPQGSRRRRRVRPPTKEEQDLADSLQQSMNDLEIAKKRHDVHNEFAKHA